MRRKKTACLLIAAVMAASCTGLAGCDSLIVKNNAKDYRQVIAEVDLSKAEDFQEGGAFADVREVVEKKSILKRDLIASYISSGYNVQNQYGWSYADTFKTLATSLVNREVFVQYAKAYLMENYAEAEGYTFEGYRSALDAVKDKSDAAKSAASLAYFLTDEEKAAADYGLRVSINTSIDTLEQQLIKAEEGDTSAVTPRTVPTGAETENEDYYDPDYRIYTGVETALGSYEKVDGSTPSLRKKAYAQFLSNLYGNELLEKGENTTNFESMSYYAIEQETAYANAVIDKCVKKFEEEAEKELTEAWSTRLFNETVNSQRDSFTKNKTVFETALDAMSSTSFVLAAPQTTEGGKTSYDKYGFVINILLPFTEMQKQTLTDASNDYGDAQGAKYATRAKLLKTLTATDQRGTWFTGSTDYSFAAGEGAFTGGNNERSYLFFENSTAPTAGKDGRYQRLENYYGKYTYNGKVVKEDDEYKLTPNKITVDGFLKEMKGYLDSAGLKVTVTKAANEAYYATTDFYKADKKNEVDYSKFIYEAGKLDAFDTAKGGAAYNANNIFLKGSNENKALSVINELSFAYNTDTAGLNTYLGYAISPYKTSFMSEFEYAAQQVVAEGAGSYAVVPTDYGWHIIYCTFSFADVAEGAASPFTFDYQKRAEEGTFSYYYFEQLKSASVSTGANNKRTDAINKYGEQCATYYESRYADLSGLDNV